MPLIFSGPGTETQRGLVTMLAPGSEDSSFQMDSWNAGGGVLSTFKSLVTGVRFSEQCNPQFRHNLGNHIYVYVFGDRMGTLVVSGLSFQIDCAGGNDLGIVRVLNWYRANRLVVRASPVLITLGSQAFQGFLGGISGGSTSNLGQRTYQFQLEFALVPAEIER